MIKGPAVKLEYERSSQRLLGVPTAIIRMTYHDRDNLPWKDRPAKSKSTRAGGGVGAPWSDCCADHGGAWVLERQFDVVPYHLAHDGERCVGGYRSSGGRS